MPDTIILTPGRTVLHGVDNSVRNFASLPVAANYAAKVMTEDLLGQYFWDGQSRLWKPWYVIPFEFAGIGRAIGDYSTGIIVPAGTIIMDAVFDVLETFTGAAGATLAFTLESAGDIKGATGFATWAAGLLAAVPAGAVANMIKTTVPRTITANVATNNLTAGHVVGFLRCVNSWLVSAVESSSSSSSSSSSKSSTSSSSSSSQS
jgi:hypothetical protein